MSADGKWVLTIAQVATPRQQIVLLPTGAGQPKELPTESLTYDVGMFSADGRRIVFGASKPGEALRMYEQDVDGGKPQRPFGQGFALSGWDTQAGVMSWNGQFVVRDPAGRPFLQSLPGGDPRPIQGFSPDEWCAGWSADGRLYVCQKAGMRIRVFRVDPATGRREVWKEIGPADAAGVWPSDGLFVTPDGSAYVYTFARRLSDLYEVEGLE